MVTTMTWLIVTEYLVSNDHRYVPFVVCCNKNNTMAARNCLPLQSTWVLPRLDTCLSGFRFIYVVTLHVFTFLVPWCDVRYDIRVKAMFGSFWFPYVFKEINVLLMLFHLFTSTGVQHDLHIRSCSYLLTVTRMLSHAEYPQLLVEFVLLNL